MLRSVSFARLSELRLPGRLRSVWPETLGVALLSLLLVGWSLGRRDLAGDELHMLRGGLWEILSLSLDPSQPFTGHLPWSFWLREVSLMIFPEDLSMAWRLHSWVAAGACSGLVCGLTRESLGRPWALLLGILVAAHPLMLFHGQDASNYAWSALTGVLLLAALQWTECGHRLDRSRWLIGALCLGAINDYWFALPAAVALGLGLWGAARSDAARTRLRNLGRVWTIPAILGALIGITLLSRGGTGEVLGSHADPGLSTGSSPLLSVPWRLLNRLNGVALDGLGAGRSDQPWESLPPILLTAVALGWVLWKGSALGRLAARLVVGSLGLAMILGVWMEWSSGRALPMEPRSFMVLLPLLLLVWVEAIRIQKGWRARGLASVLALLLFAPAWRQLASPSVMHSWAAEEVSSQAEAGDLVVAPAPLSWKLALPEGVTHVPCLSPGVPSSERIWWIRLQDGSQPLSLEPCPDQDEGTVDLSGYSLVHVDARGPPSHERNAASFLPPVVISRYEKGASVGTAEIRRELELNSGLLSGLEGGRLRLSLETQTGQVLFDERSPASVQSLQIPLETEPLALRAELLPTEPGGLPRWSLFDPFWRTIYGWEPIPVTAFQPTGTWRLEAPAMGAPLWRVVRRLLRVGLVLGLLLPLPLLYWRRSRMEARGAVLQGEVRHRGSALALGGATIGMIAWRIHRVPMDAFGDSAAQYIEHLAKMQALDRIVRAGAWEPLGLLQAGDGMYPPLLHLVTLALGALLGHGVEPAIWSGILWLGLLAGSVAYLARVLDPELGKSWGMGMAILMTPALHAVTTRYAYDLPMTALLWAGLAAVGSSFHRSDRWAWVRAGTGGILLAGAALVKWTALPFGLIMLVGLIAALRRAQGWRASLERVGVALLLASIPIGAFLASGSTSMGAMGAATFQPPVGAALEARPWLQSLMGVLPEGVGDRVGAMILQLLHLDGERLSFYPGRVITSIFSPILSIPLCLGLWTWWKNGRPGLALVATTVIGHWLFCLLLVPPLDDRFLLTLTPALTMAAVLGWLRLETPIRRYGTPCLLAAAVWVAGDFHLRSPATALHVDPSTSLAARQNGSEWGGRVGLSSSIHLRGWVRSEEVQPDRSALREKLWRTVRLCHAPVVAGPSALLTSWGDTNWWAWRDLLERTELGLKENPDPLVQYLERNTTSPDTGIRPQLLLTPEPLDAFGPPEVLPDHQVWESLGHLPDPDGGPGIRVWQLRSGGVCPQGIAE